ncbi:MurR/RpiR family transcriptional regulator [Pseudomonas sp. GX19020]|uniref:MurR/RpiR family transcriptional regulator n=1 Tax=Pseudomonas sp. GX19020 TaxID=2942277 RepID=UPI00201A02F7|nr:MurR/RpiR family transcriptional regulator [Pseudomonas sp. GX19020]MCL4066225.1 MurR/RpiR family transcriptional regulator [Pseudomonas sp. GX19020]
MAVRDLLLRSDHGLTPSEERIIRQILAEFPAPAHGTVSGLARKSGVSDPTVVRLVAKLGYESFAVFDLSRSGEGTPAQSFESACRMLAETKGRIHVIGGRFSRNIALILAGYLAHLRPGVVALLPLSARELALLADIDRNDMIVASDYRRYRPDVMPFVRDGVAAGVRLVLLTDQWLSPLEDSADVALVSQTEVNSPFDTLVSALAQVEAIVTRMLDIMGEGAARRMERIEGLRDRRQITLNQSSGAAGTESSLPEDRSL